MKITNVTQLQSKETNGQTRGSCNLEVQRVATIGVYPMAEIRVRVRSGSE